MRKLSIKSLWQASGRTGEIAWLNLNSLRWDPFFELVKAAGPQPKTSKLKFTAFVSGIDLYLDWFIDLGDYFVIGERYLYTEDDAQWFIQALQASTSARTAINTFVKALLPGPAGAVKYRQFAVKCLPAEATAGGFRPGAINTLLSAMPGEIAVHVSLLVLSCSRIRTADITHPDNRA